MRVSFVKITSITQERHDLAEQLQLRPGVGGDAELGFVERSQRRIQAVAFDGGLKPRSDQFGDGAGSLSAGRTGLLYREYDGC